MNWFYNLKIARKLTLGFGLCLLFAVLVGTVAIQRMADMKAATQNIVASAVPGDIVCGQMLYSATRFRVFEFHALVSFLVSDKKDLASVDKRLNVLQQNMDATLDNYGKMANSDEDKHNWETARTAWAAYLESHRQFLALSRANKTQAAAAMLNGPMLAQFDTLHDRVETMVDYNTRYGEAESRQAGSTYTKARLIILSLLASTLLLGSALALLITRYITSTLALVSGRINSVNRVCVVNLSAAISALEQGDLTVPIVTGTDPMPNLARDEFGQMAETFNEMLVNLQGTIASFRKSQFSLSTLVQNMQQSSAQVDGAAHTLSGTCRHISAATEEITATMQKVAEASEQSARGANEVATGSAALSRIQSVVSEMASRVLSIGTAAEEMSASAQEVSATISDVAAVVEESSAAAEEMSAAAEEVAVSVQTVAGTTAQQSVAVEELSASASQLAEVSQSLSELVSRFKAEGAVPQMRSSRSHLPLRKAA